MQRNEHPKGDKITSFDIKVIGLYIIGILGALTAGKMIFDSVSHLIASDFVKQ